MLEEAGAHAVRGTLTEAAGREFLNRIHQVASGEPIDSPTVKAWLEDWVAEKKQSRSESTHVRYDGIVRSFLAFLPAAKRKGPLAALTIADSSTWVFPSLAAVTASGRSGLSRQFRAVMDAAGIEAEMVERDGTKGRRRSTLSFHSLRHSFNSEMANTGVSQEVRQRLTGHASKAVNDAYTHTQLDTLRGAVAKVPGVSGAG